MDTQQTGELVVVTGMSGAGRSTAAKELEDLGYYVVDNLPPSLLRDVVRLVDENRGVKQPIAVGLTRFQGIYGSNPPLIQAAALMASLLPILLFIMAQRLFMQGVVVTGVEK